MAVQTLGSSLYPTYLCVREYKELTFHQVYKSCQQIANKLFWILTILCCLTLNTVVNDLTILHLDNCKKRMKFSLWIISVCYEYAISLFDMYSPNMDMRTAEVWTYLHICAVWSEALLLAHMYGAYRIYTSCGTAKVNKCILKEATLPLPFSFCLPFNRGQLLLERIYSQCLKDFFIQGSHKTMHKCSEIFHINGAPH